MADKKESCKTAEGWQKAAQLTSSMNKRQEKTELGQDGGKKFPACTE